MRSGRREAAGLALAVAVVAAGLVTAPERALSALAALADRPVLFAAVLAVVYLVRPFVAWPTVAVSAAVGYVLGPAVGLPVALCGAVVTSLPPFYGARWFRAGSGLLARIGEGGEAYFRTAGDGRGVVAARLAPIPADAVSVAAGLAGVPPWAYAAGTLLGELPWTAAAVVGGGSARTLAAARPSAGLPLVVATTLAAAMLLAGPAYRMLGEPGLDATIPDGPTDDE